MRAEEDRLRAALKAQREKRELSQRQLSITLGWHPAAIGKIERGERRVSVIELLDIARALDLDPEVLLMACLDHQEG